MREVRGTRTTGFPSPLVMLSVTAVVMAGIAFVATRDQPETERQVRAVSQAESSAETESATPEPTKAPKPRPKPVQRARITVVIFNNSNVTGMASDTAERASGAGWNITGTDNWVGTVDGSSVFYPAQLRRAAGVLARDLGIRRVKPAVEPMRMDRLTVILTDDYLG